MIMGDRGTGKSTTIRAVADLLPEIKVVDMRDEFQNGNTKIFCSELLELISKICYVLNLSLRYERFKNLSIIFLLCIN